MNIGSESGIESCIAPSASAGCALRVGWGALAMAVTAGVGALFGAAG